MKKTLLTKMLLAAVALFAGTSASWADATSIYDRGIFNEWSAADISASEWVASGATATISSGLAISGGNGDNSIAKTITTKDNSKLVFTALWNTGLSTGNAGNYNFLKFGDVEMQAWGQAGNSVIVIGGISTTLATDNKDVRDNASWTISITIDKATGDVSYEITLPSSRKKTGTGTLASTDFSSISMGFHKGGRTNSNNSTLTAIEIKEEEQAVTTASYTVKYLCGTTNVKDNVSRTGVVGSAITITAADKENVYKDGKKYIYESDNSSELTIAADVVVTVTFREATKYSYTLNAVDGEDKVLKELASGEQFEGDNSVVYFNKSFYTGGKWYTTTSACNWTFTEAATEKVTYAEDADINYFFEVEDLDKSTSWAATGAYPDRYSNGKAGRLGKGANCYTEPLEGGVYNITMWGRNQASSSTANVDVYVRDQEGIETINSEQFENWAQGSQGTKTIEVTVPVGSRIVFKNGSTEYNSNLEMDYIILQRTGDAPAVKKSVEVTSAGMATYVNQYYDLDFSAAGIKAYKAKVTAQGVCTLTEVANVPAGTPVLLIKAGGDTEDIPVMTGAAAVSDNDLVAGTGAAVATTDGEYTNMILNNVSGIGFYFANGQEVATNRAYLHIATSLAPASSSAPMMMVFADEMQTTGVNSLTPNPSPRGEGSIYNLNGQRVANPTKGLYIVNGKKFVIK